MSTISVMGSCLVIFRRARGFTLPAGETATGLRQARRQLAAGCARKEVRRADAIDLVDPAMDEVKEGMRFDRAH
jgi:hypothetical protein